MSRSVFRASSDAGKSILSLAGILRFEAGDNRVLRVDRCAENLERCARLNLVETDDLLPCGYGLAFLDEDLVHHAAVQMLHGLAVAFRPDRAIGDGGAVDGTERGPHSEETDKADENVDAAAYEARGFRGTRCVDLDGPVERNCSA